MKRLSLLMITKNSDEHIEKSLKSVRELVDEIVIIDNNSADRTRDIVQSYGAKVIVREDDDLGKQRAYGLNKVTGEWVLVLDADEIVRIELLKEIKSKLKAQSSLLYCGYFIPFQNHFLGKPIHFGGEDYKMLRLFRKDSVTINNALVHEHFEVKGKTGTLKNKIYHYSYRSITQIFKKFTDYAIREAKQKRAGGEKTSLKKLTLYPVHMFWARFIKDKGYKDGLFRIPLDIGFAYMEFLTYLLLLFFERRREE